MSWTRSFEETARKRNKCIDERKASLSIRRKPIPAMLNLGRDSLYSKLFGKVSPELGGAVQEGTDMNL
jgi:hypothetical protein